MAKQELPSSRQKEGLLTLLAPLFINHRLSKKDWLGLSTPGRPIRIILTGKGLRRQSKQVLISTSGSGFSPGRLRMSCCQRTKSLPENKGPSQKVLQIARTGKCFPVWGCRRYSPQAGSSLLGTSRPVGQVRYSAQTRRPHCLLNRKTD